MMQIVGTIETDLTALEKNLLEFCNSEMKIHNEITTHLFTAGGKRVRPAIFLLCSKLLGYHSDVRHAVAAALEYIHTASLLHDDVIDEAKIRRKRATVNQQWNNTTAILTGDRIHALASRLLVRTGNLDLIERVAHCIQLMSESEIQQLEILWQSDVVEESYLQVIRGKTAALFEVTSVAAALLSQKSDAVIHAFQVYGSELGFAFQIADDCLDFEGDAHVVGKPLLADLGEGKVTLPLIRALQSSHPSRAELQELVTTICNSHKATGAQMVRVRTLTEECGGIAAARATARAHAELACNTLRSVTAEFATTPAAKEIVEALLTVPIFSIERPF